MHDLRRVEFVARRYVELRGLLIACVGALITVTALMGRALIVADGQLLPGSSVLGAPLMLIAFAVVQIEGAYRVTLMAGSIADMIGFTIGSFRPSALAMLTLPLAIWGAVRDWRWRPYYVLLAAAAASGWLLTTGIPPGNGAAKAIAFIRCYAVIGMGVVAVGLLDHKLLITCLHPVDACVALVGVRRWPDRRHYGLVAAVLSGVTVTIAAFAPEPILAFVWLLTAASGALAVALFIDSRSIRSLPRLAAAAQHNDDAI